jgi:[lysine-biosynthesis-protein LysW]--L-2-aminoadipate ligase
MTAPARLAMLVNRVRTEEKALLAGFERRGVQVDVLPIHRLRLSLDEADLAHYDGLVNRAMALTTSLAAVRIAEHFGVPTLNTGQVIEVCGDKLLTSLALRAAGLPVPRTTVAFGPEPALEAAVKLGFPVVLKPLVGSHGRLLAKIDDPVTAEALIEYKEALPAPVHRIHYLQQYLPQTGGDIRVIVAGDDVVTAIRRTSDGWISNYARGARTEPTPPDPATEELALRAAAAVGGGLLGVDLLRDNDGELVVCEVNHAVEFAGAIAATGLDIGDRLASHLLTALRRL